jgi:hypothetical protein
MSRPIYIEQVQTIPLTGERMRTLVPVNARYLRNALPAPRHSAAAMRPGGYRPTRPSIPAPRPPAQTVPVCREEEASPAPVPESSVIIADSQGGHYVRIDAMAGLIPMAGKLWAAFLGRPDMPPITGENQTDHANQVLHADALAAHQQQQKRIETATELVGRLFDHLLR